LAACRGSGRRSSSVVVERGPEIARSCCPRIALDLQDAANLLNVTGCRNVTFAESSNGILLRPGFLSSGHDQAVGCLDWLCRLNQFCGPVVGSPQPATEAGHNGL